MADVVVDMDDTPPLASTLPSSQLEFPTASSPCNAPRARQRSASADRDFWVSPPLIDPNEKAKYKSMQLNTYSIPSSSDEDDTPVMVVGETHQGTDLFYWVLHENDVIHKYLAKTFEASYPELVDAYDENKRLGTLDTFDEKSSRIHPNDRTNPKITISDTYGRARRRTTRASLSRATSYSASNLADASDDETNDSQDDYESQADMDGDEDNIKAKPKTAMFIRRSTRTTAIDNELNYREMSPNPVKTRANLKRYNTRNHGNDGYVESDEDDDVQDDSEENVRPKPKSKRAPRGRLSRPAYGNIRPVADLSDDDSDVETTALRAHRKRCQRCQKLPAHALLMALYKQGKKTNIKKSNEDDFEDNDNEEQRYLRLGGWVRCLKCCVTAHWGCLGRSLHAEIIKAAREKAKEAEAAGFKPRKRETLEAYDTTEFICDACMKGGICMYCHKVAVTGEPLRQRKSEVEGEPQTLVAPLTPSIPDAMSAVNMPREDEEGPIVPPAIVIDTVSRAGNDTGNTRSIEEPKTSGSPGLPSSEASELLFRCKTCKRLAHYAHLPQPEGGADLTLAQLAHYYQSTYDWECTDCISYIHPLDAILAWRPYPANAVESDQPTGSVPAYKADLPREYLVKWVGRSYRRLQWVPHMWLASTCSTKLKNFLVSGPKVQLLDIAQDGEGDRTQDNLVVADIAKQSDASIVVASDNSRDPSAQPTSEEEQGPPPPLPDAESRVPATWRTIDRVLDVRLWDPTRYNQSQRGKNVKARQRGRTTKQKRIESDLEDGTDMDNADEQARAAAIALFEEGEESSQNVLETVKQWEKRTGKTLGSEDAQLVVGAFIKWVDLAYEEATWDSVPIPSDSGYYPAFERAFSRFLDSRKVFVVRKSRQAALIFDDRKKTSFERQGLQLKSDPDLGQKGKLMDFQLTGVNWLLRNWWIHQPSILADEMGLGKTVQIACLIGHLVEVFKAYPVLIVVPNSTITNWLREFERWAPNIRVVSFNGEAKSREIIRKYELYHESVPKNHTNLKFHVLVTTYETLIGKDFSSVFKAVPRWELLIVDEGQRLKSDSSLLFKRLNELNTIHRILMTGTPLNNNIRELFNLMNFLDPNQWNNLNDLEKKYEDLSEELLQELHESLKPYFLRRTKADVLTLPPKNEVIVPVSMTAIQKEVYKSLLSQNMEILGSLAQPSSQVSTTVKKYNINNLLMQLRKCLQHPYLVSRELEPTGSSLTSQAVHKNLVDASAKLRLLHILLPKLKARGHRVLIFSQFVIALDVIEDFLAGEGHKFLRLDGSIKQAQRQKDMDAFNRPDSDTFIFLLSTRAGGVGINLWSADTVIIFDPDFNPHQDLQAISRAHRYGQTKTVLVFKLMVKGAAEERIVQTGKKKLALDHLIVQKMDDEGGDDVKSILTFGAKAVFEDTETNDINYSEEDIDNLIARTEKEGEDVPEATRSSFGFAKLWVVEKDTLEEVSEDVTADAHDDGFWGDVLARAAAEKAKAKAAEVTGRGAKRRAAAVQKYYYDDGSPSKPAAKAKKRRKSSNDSDVEYNASEMGSNGGRSGSSTATAPYLSDDDIGSQGHRKPTLDPLPLGPSRPTIPLAPQRPTIPLAPQRPTIPLAPQWPTIPPSPQRPTIPLAPQWPTIPPSPQRPTIPPALQRPTTAPTPQRLQLTYKPALTAIEHQRSYTPDESDDERPCGLCKSVHASGSCLMTQDPSNLLVYRLMLLTESRESIESRRLAVQAIDANLARRGLHHLIKRQPSGFSSHGVEASQKPLKRPASSSSSVSNKRPKMVDSGANFCVICGGPLHLVKVCPVVKSGPESIKQAIVRLSGDPQLYNTVNILLSFLPPPTDSQLTGSSAPGMIGDSG